MASKKEQSSNPGQNMDQTDDNQLNRRSILKALAGVPFLGVFAYQVMKDLSFDSGKERQYRIIKALGLESNDAVKPIQRTPASEFNTLRVGFIGYGNRAPALAKGLGFMHPVEAAERKKNGTLEDWMMQENLNIELAAICDVFDLHAQNGMETARNGLRINGDEGTDYPVKRYRTYQEMLADENIDAVIIATPDHHHARMSIDAIKAGKHVYCEKSVSLSEEELFELYDVVNNSDRVYQLGHQISQNIIFQQAKDIINKNILGKITLIETTTNRNSASGAWIRDVDSNGNPKPGDLQSIDWDQWLGSAPKVPFSRDRFYNWTKFFDYDFGVLGQLFTHEYDAINQLLRIGIPKSVVASGGIYYWKDNRDIPDVLNCVFDYPDKELVMTYSATLANSRPRGRVIMGHDASMELGSSIILTADNDSTRYSKQIKEGVFNTKDPMLTISPDSGVDGVSGATVNAGYYASRGLTDTVINGQQIDITHLHIKEWIDCIRHGGTPSAGIEKSFEEGITTLMAQRAYVEKRRVEWDPVLRRIV